MKKIKIAICAALALASAGCGSKLPVEQEYIEGQTETAESGTEIIGTEQEISAEWEEEASKAARVYDSATDFEEEFQEVPYADSATVDALKATYDKIDFHGTFEVGNTKVYEDYKEKYRKLVNEEVPFWNKAGSEAFYLSEYGVFARYPEEEYLYYFFDVDGDGAPELSIFKKWGFSCCIFDYDAEEDRFYLWHELGSTWNWVGGTKKAFWMRLGIHLQYEFYQLDEHGEVEIISYFYSYVFNETQKLNMICIPEYADGKSMMELTDEVKSQGIFTKDNGSWYFRVSDEDFEELENRYMEAFEEAGKQKEEVTYTYEELFGADGE